MKWEIQLTEFPMRTVSFLERHDRKLLAAHAREDWFCEIVQTVARRRGVSEEEVNEVMNRVIDWQNYANIDHDVEAQRIGKDVLWFVHQHTMGIIKRESAQNLLFGAFCVIAALILVCLLQDVTNYFLLSGVHDVPSPL